VELSELTRRALEVREAYRVHEERTYGRQWSTLDLMLGLVGDVGDLTKLVQAHEGIRVLEGGRDALEHELADVLWSLLVIADRCGVDLAAAFVRTMDELEGALGGD
jgi:NTP pyrophosphatase (non-canonical NTP hydrolase)